MFDNDKYSGADPSIEKVTLENWDVASASRDSVAAGAVRMMESVQAMPAKVQAMAAAAALWAIVRSTQLRPLDLLGYVDRMATDNESHSRRMHPTFAALDWHTRDYLLGKRYS